MVDNLPRRGTVRFGAVLPQLTGLHVRQDFLHRPTVRQGTIIAVRVFRFPSLAFVSVQKQHQLLLDEFTLFRIRQQRITGTTLGRTGLLLLLAGCSGSCSCRSHRTRWVHLIHWLVLSSCLWSDCGRWNSGLRLRR